MDIKTEQLNILLNGIKKVVGSKNCPEWIAKSLTQTVKNAKDLSSDKIPNNTTNSHEIDYTYKPFNINDNVVSNIQDDTCLYKIIAQHDPINNINLFTLQIIEGNKTNPPGTMIYNVPETMLLHIKD